jgi:acyl-coenzyme A thioesterase PaaI-like protein
MARRPRKSDPANGLNSIHGGIHCAATNEGVSDTNELDEVQQLQVNHFLQTLADVALAVAARKAASEGGKVECEP